MSLVERLSSATGSEGQSAPPIKGACAPRRLHRTRGKNAFTPSGAIYVGRPTWWGNPFAYRSRINHKRSVILHAAWIAGQLDPYILARCGFGEHEIAGLGRWQSWLLRHLPRLQGSNLQCWCPLTSAWCHADTLLPLANPIGHA